METTEQFFAAVDLHGNNGYYAICDQHGRRVWGKRLPNALPVVLQALSAYRDRLQKPIAIESTFNWYWLADGLMDHGYPVVLVNPARVQQYSGLKHTGDDTDAFHLADLQRLGLLPTAYLYPKQLRPVRDLLRRRMLLVHQRTSHLLSFKSLLARQEAGHISASRLQQLECADLDALFASEPRAARMGRINLEVIEFLSAQIKAIEADVLAVCRPQEVWQRLQTLPGVGRILAMVIWLESGDLSRFASAGHFTSYCRGAKAARWSNNKKKAEGNTRNGNRYLSWAFIEAAAFAIRYDEAARRWYQRKLTRCGGLSVLARKALAAKLAKAAWHVMAQGERFETEKLFGSRACGDRPANQPGGWTPTQSVSGAADRSPKRFVVEAADSDSVNCVSPATAANEGLESPARAG